jgi:endonuclease/exonuclease/phosphatase family metal-dependent hydrolase
MFTRHGYRDLISEFSIDTTRNHLAWDRHPTKMYYSDYIFVNEMVQLERFEVPKNEVSDHLPMLLEIEV